jgi:hypothetical protein
VAFASAAAADVVFLAADVVFLAGGVLLTRISTRSAALRDLALDY